MKTTQQAQKYNFASPPNYQTESRLAKLKRRVRSLFVTKIANTFFQFKIYPSYWHYKLLNNGTDNSHLNKKHYLYLKPNYGAGIGHQLANWNAGLYFAKYYNLQFAHSPFSSNKWESFLGLGENETLASELKEGFKNVQLPRFDSENPEEVNLVGNIIRSYGDKNVLFSLEIDQGYMRQYETGALISKKFFSAASRNNDKLIFEPGVCNIAIHIRRRMAIETEEVWASRGLNNSYYENILKQILAVLPASWPVKIYLFSQGEKDDFPEFEAYSDLIYCMDMGPVESFLHMVYADILVSSKSSFSYKPALISRGIKICPQSFWHDYPQTDDFILADNAGIFDKKKLAGLIESGNNESFKNAVI